MTDPHPVRTIVVTRRFDHAPAAVFDAWLDPAAAGAFLFATPAGVMQKVEIDARVGGRFEFAELRDGVLVRHVGVYHEIDRPRRLAFSFTAFAQGADEPPMTRVTIEIAPDHNAAGDGVFLTLTHEGVWADYAERTEGGWTKILDGLAHIL